MFDLNDPMVQEYIIEAKEHLVAFEEGLLNLRMDSDKKLIDQMFRNIHTVKGGSGFFGFVRIGELSHAIESVMDRLRAQKLQYSEALIDTLLEGTDLLKNLFDRIVESNEIDISSYLVKTESYLEESLLQKDSSISSLCRVYTELIKQEEEAGKFLYYLAFANKADENSGRLELKLLGDMHEIDESHKESPHSLMVASVLEPEIFLSSFNLPHNRLFQMQETKEEKPEVTSQSSSSQKISTKKTVDNTIRIKLPLLDELMRQAGELVIIRNQFMVNYDKDDPQMRSFAMSLDSVTSTLQ